MDIILPVAGFGSRLRPHTWSKPKPLVTVAGKAMLAHVLDRVMPLQPGKIVFITGYLGEQIKAWARATYPDTELVFVEQPEMLGQSDALYRTREFVDGDAIMLFPDALFEADFSQLTQLDVDGVAYTYYVEDPSAYGVALQNDEGFVSKIVEKPAEPISHEAVIGIYYFREWQALMRAIEEQFAKKIMLKGEYFIADAINLMLDAGAKFTINQISVWEDCGNVDALLDTNRYLLGAEPPSPAQRPGSLIVPPSFVHRDAVLEDAVIGPYASIGAGTVVRNSVIRDSIVEENSEVVDAILQRSMVGSKVVIQGSARSISVGDNGKVAL
ncbi:MAG: sugar phosphate nucleotidyltransferase [Thermomicrobiales bacterium]|nr:sugar phosphate nucleotidyltransferase [Thermomicrobiales bacterium]MCO5217870.1 sugar phosphate nucleotidyltransferase [Thermomicrobiales bacterium]MCO5223877.1 sugar phosphate nucleotidyltransferase [Thermomicrobiales bacterium]MCO5227441.1 sugar phosphate nucleotidyltransferase [Thermomicrobiales bacterium]